MFSIFCLYSRNVLHVKHNTFRTRWMKLSGYSQDKNQSKMVQWLIQKVAVTMFSICKVNTVVRLVTTPHAKVNIKTGCYVCQSHSPTLRWREIQPGPPLWRKAIRTCFPIKGRCYAGNDAISSVLGRTSISVSHSILAAIWSLPEASHLLACAVLQILLQRSQWW